MSKIQNISLKIPSPDRRLDQTLLVENKQKSSKKKKKNLKEKHTNVVLDFLDWLLGYKSDAVFGLCHLKEFVISKHLGILSVPLHRHRGPL